MSSKIRLLFYSVRYIFGEHCLTSFPVCWVEHCYYILSHTNERTPTITITLINNALCALESMYETIQSTKHFDVHFSGIRKIIYYYNRQSLSSSELKIFLWVAKTVRDYVDDVETNCKTTMSVYGAKCISSYIIAVDFSSMAVSQSTPTRGTV